MKRVPLRKYDILSILLCLPAILPGIIVYSRLPEQVPTHFTINGVPDGYSTRAFAVFGMPLIVAAIQAVLCVLTNLFWKEKREGRGEMVIRLLMPIVLYVIQTAMLLYALGRLTNVMPVVGILMTITLLLLGNYMPKIRRNVIVGIRTPHSLASPEIWDKTNRFTGRVFVIAGVLSMIITAAGTNLMLLAGVLLAAVLIPFIYSEILYRRYRISVSKQRSEL